MLSRVVAAVALMSSYALGGSSASIPDWVRAAAKETVSVPADSEAVVLLDDESTTVRDNGETYVHYRRVVKILRPQGREHAIVGVDFDREKKLLALHAWTISPKGEEYEIKDKEFLETGSFGEDLYSDIRVKFTEPPAIGPGSIIAFEFERRDRPYLLENDWTFQEAIPVKHAVYSITLPSSWEYKTVWVRHPEMKPVVTGNTSTWQLEDIPAIVREPAMPSRSSLDGRMVLTFFSSTTAAFNSWPNIAKWYSGLTADRRSATPEIRAAAQQITAGKSSYLEKVEAIAAFMQAKIRYVSVQIGIGGYQPHFANDVLLRHYGDCKDKATLMSTLLQQSGIQSHYLLVDSSRGVVVKDAPSTHFNHVILAIDLPSDADTKQLQTVVSASDGKRYLIFDPTDEFTPLGMLHSGLQDSYGLLVLNGTGELIHLPLVEPEINQLHRTAKVQLQDDGSITGTVTEVRTGDAAWLTRARTIHSSEVEQHKRMERFLTDYLTGVTLGDLKYEHLDDFKKELVVNYSFTAQSYAKKAGPLVFVRLRVLGSKIPEFGIPPRKNPFAFESTTRQVDDIDIELPTGYVVEELPSPAKVDVGFASYSSAIASSGHSIHYSREYVIRNVAVESDKEKEFEHLAGVISADQRSSAIIRKGP